jgi:hypothetical protein
VLSVLSRLGGVAAPTGDAISVFLEKKQKMRKTTLSCPACLLFWCFFLLFLQMSPPRQPPLAPQLFQFPSDSPAPLISLLKDHKGFFNIQQCSILIRERSHPLER